MLKSQGVSGPAAPGFYWPDVEHVDEFVLFLPTNTPRGWTIGVAGTRPD